MTTPASCPASPWGFGPLVASSGPGRIITSAKWKQETGGLSHSILIFKPAQPLQHLLLSASPTSVVLVKYLNPNPLRIGLDSRAETENLQFSDRKTDLFSPATEN